MLADITSMRNAIIELKAVKNNSDFESILYNLRVFLKTLDMDPKCLMELEQRAYYPINEYYSPSLITTIFFWKAFWNGLLTNAAVSRKNICQG